MILYKCESQKLKKLFQNDKSFINHPIGYRILRILILSISLVILSAYASLIHAEQEIVLEREVRYVQGRRTAADGQAAYTGEFYRVNGRKIQLLRSLEKAAVRCLPNEAFSAMNQLQALIEPKGEFIIEHEALEHGITILQTPTFNTLDELTESLRRLEQVPGVLQAVPVYIHEESGLELIATEEFIVKLSMGASLAELEVINQATGAVITRNLSGTTDQFILALPDCTPEELLSLCEIYWQDQAIEWAEPNFLGQVLQCDLHPNDPYYDLYQWHLPDIDAPGAWDITTGSDQICIAIIDDGMKLTHEDLAANLFTNSGEIPGNWIDDDDNGYRDDYNGWNFYEQNKNPNPASELDSHGTAVAGIAAAIGNNGVGVTGCAFNCKLMPLKVTKGYYYVFSGISEAILYAAGFAKNGTDRWRGTDIINISLGLSCANCLDDAIAKATTDGRKGKGCAIFCSSGNDAGGWSSSSVEVSSGYHTIRWEYVKDSDVSLYADTVWIDNVTFPDGSTETFEGGNLPSGWSTGGNANWVRVQDGVDGNHAMTGWDGPSSHSMRAGSIGHSKSTYLQVRKNFQEGNIKSNYWVSTEPFWRSKVTGELRGDALRVTVDGEPLTEQGPEGPQNWMRAGAPYIRISIGYPASHPDTVAVGASTNFGYRSDYSCYGYGLDYVAPSSGGSKYTVTTGYKPGPEDSYTYFSGTSSSSPLAAGVGALILSKNPNLTASQVRQVMQESCDQIGNVTYDENGWNKYYGYGRINVQAALANTPESTGAIKLTAPDGTSGDWFGFAVSLEGDYAIIGALDDTGTDSGFAYIFKRVGNSWNQQDKLIPSDGAPGDGFGWTVSISGDYAIMGAPFDDDNGTRSGSAYIFKRNGSIWSQQDKLTASDGASQDAFGCSVSISGDFAIIGAHSDDDNGFSSGSAYIFRRVGNSWTQQDKLIASDGVNIDYFGTSVSINGDYAAIGSYKDDDNVSDSGSAYIFKRSGASWIQQKKLTALDGAADDWFGRSVSLDKDFAIIGADGNGFGSGCAYIFRRVGNSWTQQDKLIASDEAPGDRFGTSVSINGDYAIIGAVYDDDNGNKSGSAYIFKRNGSNWTHKEKLIAWDGDADDYFGNSVSISRDYAIIGAPCDDDNGDNSGSAYIYRIGE